MITYNPDTGSTLVRAADIPPECDVFYSLAWDDIDQPLTLDEVTECIRDKKAIDPSSALAYSSARQTHICRIAWCVTHPADEPIYINRNGHNAGYRSTWTVAYGTYALSAALYKWQTASADTMLEIFVDNH